MPSSDPQIPAEGLGLAAAALNCRNQEAVGGFLPVEITWVAREIVEAAYPHLLAAWSEQLLSDEAVEAAVEESGIGPGSTRKVIEAALASIDSSGGTG